MADTHDHGAHGHTHGHGHGHGHGHDVAHGHHGPNMTVYLSVAGALAVFTIVSFVVNAWVRGDHDNRAMTGLAIILAVAVCKAGLVAAFFMHVKYDFGKVYFIIFPI